MQAELLELAGSRWFALASGLASILGCLLAVYPVQVSGIDPSVYRGLIWQKTLTWAAGLGIIVFSIAQIYSQPSPDPESPAGLIYELLTGSVSASVLEEQFSQTQTGPMNTRIRAVTGVNTGPQTERVPSIQTGTGGDGDSRLQSGGSGQLTVGGNSQVTGYPIGAAGDGNPPAGRGNDAHLYRGQFWFVTLLIGAALLFIGCFRDPFGATMSRLEMLDGEFESRRKRFMNKIQAADDLERTALVEAYDRNAELTRAALFYMLTGYRLQLPSIGESRLSTNDRRAFASAIASAKRQAEASED